MFLLELLLLHSHAVPPLEKKSPGVSFLFCFPVRELPQEVLPCKTLGEDRGTEKPRSPPGVPAPAAATFPGVIELAAGLFYSPAKHSLSPSLFFSFSSAKTKPPFGGWGSHELGLLTAPRALGGGEASWSGAARSPAASVMG